MEPFEHIPVEIYPIGAKWESIFYSLTWEYDIIDFRFWLQNLIKVASPVNANNSMEQIEPISVEIDPIGATWESKYISYSLTWGNDVIEITSVCKM